MADSTNALPESEPRAHSQSAHSPAPPAAQFTAYNVDAEGQPRRLTHVSPGRMREILETGVSSGDRGPEPGFRGQPHGTDYRDDVLPNNADHEHAAVDHNEEEDEVEEESEQGEKVRAPGEAVQTPEVGTNKRKMSSASGTSTPVANGSGIEQAHKRGRKPGAQKKPLPRGWTEKESISLLELHIANPTATHKVIAEMHHATFWKGDSTWAGRTHAACQQRMIMLNSSKRDRALLPGVVDGLKSNLEDAGYAEAKESGLGGAVDGAVDETAAEDKEADGGTAVPQSKKRRVDSPVEKEALLESSDKTMDDGKGKALPPASPGTDEAAESDPESASGDVAAAAQLLLDFSRKQ